MPLILWRARQLATPAAIGYLSLMRRKTAIPDLTAPILVVVVIMSVLFGLVQRVARVIDTARAAPDNLQLQP
jgi:hypothetical protein